MTRFASTKHFSSGRVQRFMIIGRSLPGRFAGVFMLTITLLMDPASVVLVDANALPTDMGLFHRTESTYRALRAALERSPLAGAVTVMPSSSGRNLVVRAEKAA